MGIFFDPGELEALSEKSVSNVFEINHRRLESVNRELYNRTTRIQYIKCPVCSTFMRRTNFGSRSGVIVDRCRDHGVWLDGGELKRLMEWKKAGGELLHEKLMAEKKKSQAKKSRRAGQNNAIADVMMNNYRSSQSWDTSANDADLLSTVSNIVTRLFK